jgi:hypothetical protein
MNWNEISRRLGKSTFSTELTTLQSLISLGLFIKAADRLHSAFEADGSPPTTFLQQIACGDLFLHKSLC